MTLTAARQVADAVLYEGYLLYPYRATSPKNQVRWQFGVLGPTGAPSEFGEDPSLQVECLLSLDPGRDAELSVYLRCLHVLDRRVSRLTPDGLVDVAELQVSGARWIPWQEATECEIPVLGLSVAGLGTGIDLPVSIAGGEDHEDLYDGDVLVGRLTRTRRPLLATLSLSTRPADTGTVLRARMTNLVQWDGTTSRAGVSRDSFVGTHLLMELRGGQFRSLTDDNAHDCHNERCWPVLVADDDGADALLVAPIILPDHPTIAPESAGDLFDATEIDEILTLRIMTLTDDEKLAARGTDARAGAIIDRSDGMPREILERLHGAARSVAPPAPAPSASPDGPIAEEALPWWDPAVDATFSPEADTVVVDGVTVGKGSRVRLRPGRGGDAQDMFVDGLTATVTGVYRDVDGATHVAVTVDDDPATEVHEWYGRFSYFRPDELEPLP